MRSRRGAFALATQGVDAQAALARRDEVIHDLDDSVMVPWLEDRGIALFREPARLAGERLEVAELMVAAGRTPRTRDIGLVTAGVALEDPPGRLFRSSRPATRPG